MTFLDTMLFSAPLLAPSETLACQPHVPPDWHKGRQDYAVWLLEIEQNDVQQRLQQARSHLDTWLMDSERQTFSPMLAILSAQHEVQYSRLFRS